MIRRILFYTAPVLSLVISFSVIWSYPSLLNVGQTHGTDTLTADEKTLLREGDLILIQGTGYTGDLILLALNEDVPLSHCGIIVYRNDTLWVVHTISPGLSGIDGVQAHPLDEFSQKSQPASTLIVRPRWQATGPGDGREAAARALYYLTRKVPFDNVFDFESRDKMYCTELLYQVLDDGGFWKGRAVPRLKGGVLPFNVFLEPDAFAVIINHQD
jgi:hypothetical protein